MEFVDPNDIWKLRDTVLSKVPIIDLAKEYHVKLEPKDTGVFSHWAYCPFHVGKGSDGKERTPSLFFSKDTNSFHCFGCGKSGSVLDFIMYMDGTPPSVALEKLAKKLGLIDKNGKWDDLQLDVIDHRVSEFDPRKTIEPYVFEISSGLRNYIKRYVGTEGFEKELKWMERVATKVDKLLVTTGYEDWEYARDMSESVQKSIKNRIKKKDEE